MRLKYNKKKKTAVRMQQLCTLRPTYKRNSSGGVPSEELLSMFTTKNRTFNDVSTVNYFLTLH
jgi:hypothetical protein